ncbi:hypothetical protein CCUS01_09827 [Colletotrichum cuscutae]|uniref:Uncharacterized protein n=1 Tax=Colletotrichum cuscutae TaxID=1209917 RepID=A0AAI9XRG3_9PEZI|nr:hypothetical protein CCUS01_09827 [Colletotrichum cuscutae]
MATWIMQKCLIVQPEGKENGRETGGWSVDDEGRLGHRGGYLTCFVLVLAFGVGLGLETKSVCGWAVLGTKYRCLYCVCSCGMARFGMFWHWHVDGHARSSHCLYPRTRHPIDLFSNCSDDSFGKYAKSQRLTKFCSIVRSAVFDLNTDTEYGVSVL